jgi:hypothetical protein
LTRLCLVLTPVQWCCDLREERVWAWLLIWQQRKKNAQRVLWPFLVEATHCGGVRRLYTFLMVGMQGYLQEGAALRDHTSLYYTYRLSQGQGRSRGCRGLSQQHNKAIKFTRIHYKGEATSVTSIYWLLKCIRMHIQDESPLKEESHVNVVIYIYFYFYP